jgi:hypothetical protein
MLELERGKGGSTKKGGWSPCTESESIPMVRKNTVLLKNGNPQGNPNNAPRCGAKTRKGTPCKGPAMLNGRCRMHGGKSTGPRTPEGLERSREANFKHGLYSAESIATQRYIRWLVAERYALIEKI